MNRRTFIARSAQAAGAILAGRALGADSNPFAYDVAKFARTDPKLIHYREVRRFRCPRPEPRRFTIGPDDRLYVAAGKSVSILTNEGQPVSEIALDTAARAVAVAKDGTVFISLRDHLEVFDAKGARRAAWESPGERPWITGLAVTENDVFAADSGHRVVLRYDRSGKIAGRIGEKNKEREIPGFIIPSPYLDVRLHPDGLLRVNNPGRHQIEAYTLGGDLELSWGKPSAAIDGFCGCCNPVSIAPLPDGRIVTAEKGIPRVKVYSVHGAFESVVAGMEAFPENAKVCEGGDSERAALDVAVDSRGDIFILDLVAGDIRVMNKKG